MKKFALLTLSVFALLLSSNHAEAQRNLALHGGYDFQFNAAYIGVGGEFAEKYLVTGELGLSSSQYIAKLDLAHRILRFDEEQVNVFLGLGGGRAFSRFEGDYDDWMAELFVSVNWYPMYVGYGFGFYDPLDPSLNGFGNYHYFRIGVLIGD